jgi:maleate cis-trans isomerase
METPCTVPRAQRSRGTLERDRKPAISAASAMMWRALHLAGVRAPIAGYGRLLAGVEQR